MMRRRMACLCFFSFWILCSAGLCTQSSWAGEEEIYTCREAEFGIKFSCNPDWAVHFNEKADMFVISEEPEVVLTVVREKTTFISLEQLSMDTLKTIGNYADGFKFERVKIDGIDAVKVKAYDRQYEDVRLTDVYILKNEFLYKILFSVAPSTEWDRYQFLLKKIMASFKFI